MQVILETQDIRLPAGSRGDLMDRVRRSLTRLNDSIARLHVHLKDINGPRGGRDKICMLRAELASGGQIVVVDQSSELRRAISRCLRRGRSLVSRELQRRRERSM